jgi:uncharacterized repeat protein (TIGR01451 family)
MSKVKVLTSMLSASVVTAAIIASPALAWHPKGVIVKYVENQTAGTAKSDANDAAHAVAAKPGDVLKYTIVVSNNGAADSKGYNDMAKTVMTDTLPAGVELVSNPSTRTISENLGLIKPGQSVTKEYLVKVTADKDGVIENKACFTGDSTANDNPQKGCDVADVKVTVPVTPPEQPKTPETPTQPQQPETPAPAAPVELPNTGSAVALGGLAGAGTIGVAGYQYLRSKRNLRSAHNR